MFIDVTRYGGLRLLRLAVPAIAYLDAVEGGTAVHLIGGETLRVNEDPDALERRVDATLALSSSAIAPPPAPTPAPESPVAKPQTGRKRT